MRLARRVLDDQIKALTDLRDVLKQCRSFNRGSSPNDERYYTNTIDIPVISSQNPAQMLHTLEKLDGVLEDRRSLRRKISDFINTLSKIVEQKDTTTLQQTIQEQIRYAEALNDEVTYQGKSISAFTALNVFFLPLGFFSQV